MIVIPPSLTHSAPGVPDAPPVIIDLEISLHKSTVPLADRTKYENIIGYLADAVFEASNGENKIGTVTFYLGGACASKADIVWVASCHPNGAVSGRAVNGQNIEFCDVFPGTTITSYFLNSDTDHQGGGYTLGHEMGHYYYSLYDEYLGDVSYDSIFHFPHSTDNPVQDAIMNYQWGAVGGNYKWLNFSIAKNYQISGGGTRVTAQSRVYGASAWDTLARAVSADPRDGQRATLPVRIHHPELAAVAPAAGADAAIDLPNTAARSALNVVWGSCSIAYQIVIDKSGSMNIPSKMPNVKKAAKMLVDLAPVGYSTIGVIAYDDTVTVVQPLTAITTANKATIKTKIDNITITPGAFTAIGDAAKKALDDMLASGIVTKDQNKVVYLLSDGISNRGINPLSVIPAYQTAKIPLYTFAYGSDADVTLMQKLATDTDGKYYFSPTTLLDITNAFQDANLQTSPSVGISSDAVVVEPTEYMYSPQSADNQGISILVDSTLKNLDVVVVYEGSEDDMYLELTPPGGYPYYSPDYCEESGTMTETLCYFGVGVSPFDVGYWLLTPTNNSDKDITVNYQASGLSDTFTYAASVTAFPGDPTDAASVTAFPGDPIQPSQPVTLLGVLSKGIPIGGAYAIATITEPNGSKFQLELRDNGELPDTVMNDGQYTAVFEPNEIGAYNIAVQFYAYTGLAYTTELSHMPSHAKDGTALPLGPPVPVADDFNRFMRIQVNVNIPDTDFIYLPFAQR